MCGARKEITNRYRTLRYLLRLLFLLKIGYITQERQILLLYLLFDVSYRVRKKSRVCWMFRVGGISNITYTHKTPVFFCRVHSHYRPIPRVAYYCSGTHYTLSLPSFVTQKVKFGEIEEKSTLGRRNILSSDNHWNFNPARWQADFNVSGLSRSLFFGVIQRKNTYCKANVNCAWYGVLI